jgi:phosphoglycolate phosphatase-like HAD superfamily hydrolase
MLPGVGALLDAIEAHPALIAAILTGNVRVGARLKLGAVGIADRFRFGAYGCDSAVREELPAVALDRAERELGHRFGARDTVVVGDTPRDVSCGRYAGARTLGVATGPYDAETLREAGADHVFGDLRETARVMEALIR